MALALGVLSLSCQSLYYSTMEAFGFEKRELLAERVEEGRDAQQGAGEQFQSTLEAFKAVTGFDGGDLEQAYEVLNARYQRCESQARLVSKRIDDIEQVAEDLFSEWAEENRQYTSEDLRSRSEDLLAQTRSHYEGVIGAMKRAESRMPPVLGAFRDQVLFLKHNLNAQAVASLRGSVEEIEQDVAGLIAEMRAAIEEADAFIGTLG
jgi:ElaB/YqjD/DUF883 family membrane-anchored ribosome-binding protein